MLNIAYIAVRASRYIAALAEPFGSIRLSIPSNVVRWSVRGGSEGGLGEGRLWMVKPSSRSDSSKVEGIQIILRSRLRHLPTTFYTAGLPWPSEHGNQIYFGDETSKCVRGRGNVFPDGCGHRDLEPGSLRSPFFTDNQIAK